jgi:hypothetical protein
MKIILANAIKSINDSAEFIYDNEDINNIVWLNETQPIPKNTILTKQSELQALEDVYVNRRKEYGTVVSQLDEIYHNGIDSWKARIANIKLNNPKE